MQYTSTQREEEEEGEKRGKVQGSRAGNKSKGQKNHLTTTSWAKLKKREKQVKIASIFTTTLSKGSRGEKQQEGEGERGSWKWHCSCRRTDVSVVMN